jgi:hypothetical protein
MESNNTKKLKKQRIERWLLLFFFLMPFWIVYVIYLKATYGDIDFSLEHVGPGCIIFTALYLCIVVYELYKKEILNRIMLSIGFCIGGAAIVYVGDITSLAYYYNNESYILYFICLVVVGIITTFFTNAGFIGIDYRDKQEVQKESLKLLAWMSVSFVGIMVLNTYFLLKDVWLVLILCMNTLYDHYCEKIEKKKSV